MQLRRREDAMTFPRRRFLHLAAGAAALPAVSRFAAAETWPARPMHIVVGFPAGNAPDIIARLIGQSLSERLGQQVIVENRPGAGSTIATEGVVNAPADGYTLMLVVLSNALNATLYTNLRYDLKRDLVGVAGVANAPFVMMVNPEFPPKTVPEFIAYAKAHPGKINMASGGNGTSTHVFGELFKMMAGVDLVHIPYRGNYIPDLLSGQTQVLFGPIPQSIGNLRAGKLRALGVTTAKRLEALPDVPPIGDFLPGYDAVGWFGLAAPKDTPPEIVKRINAETNAALADAQFKAKLANLGVEPMVTTPDGYTRFIADEVDKWAKVIRHAAIKPDL
jgi:tripartite-type tricarboxylate transporter receptor subunit TctC